VDGELTVKLYCPRMIHADLRSCLLQQQLPLTTAAAGCGIYRRASNPLTPLCGGGGGLAEIDVVRPVEQSGEVVRQ